MLHSIERYFLDPVKQYKMYDDIVSAIEFLNTLVEKGIIRYLGISSNTFALPENNNFVDLLKIISLLKEKKNNKNLKFLQFPYNLNETHADQKNLKSKSLLEIVQENKIISLTNRPLNTTFNNTVVRLATYEEEIKNLDSEKEELLFRSFLNTLQVQLGKIGETESNIISFAPIKFLVENRKHIANPEALDITFNKHLIPFLKALYQEKMDKSLLVILNELRMYWYLYSKKTLTENALKLKNELITKQIISSDDKGSLTEIALHHYFNKCKIDHVLVGMKNIKYVEQLKKFNQV